MLKRLTYLAVGVPFACAIAACRHPEVKLVDTPARAPLSELWEAPSAEAGDTVNGPWGATNAPDCSEPFKLSGRKTTGSNPGLVVKDAKGREWSVKQPPMITAGAEGPVEVVLSRVLSAVGYHQPPVYFLPTLMVKDRAGTHCELGGRFRLKDDRLKELGPWSWKTNPFVETTEFRGLLVILAMFNSSDLKDSNNSVYDAREMPPGQDRWYVVRDLGTALGETGRLSPRRGNPDLFDKEAFIVGVKDGFVEFNHHSLYAELLQHRIRPADVTWAADRLGALTDRQWSDAFRTAGFEPAVGDRFTRRLQQKIAEGRRLGMVPKLGVARPADLLQVTPW